MRRPRPRPRPRPRLPSPSPSPSRCKIPRKQSHTTLIAIRFKNCCLLGADSRVCDGFYARVLSNSMQKVLMADNGYSILYSGDGDVAFDLKSFLPQEFDLKAPQSMEEVANAACKYINQYMYVFRTEVELIVAGSMSGEPFKLFLITKDEKYWKHFVVPVKEKFVICGTGSKSAGEFLQGNSLMDKDVISEKEGCEVVLGALKAAVVQDPGTGGVLEVIYMTHSDYKMFYWKQENAKYCKSEYRPLEELKLPKEQWPKKF